MPILKNTSFRLLAETILLLALVYVALPPAGKQRFLLGTPGLVPCAVSVTQIQNSNDQQQLTVIASADADTTTGAQTHTMGGRPDITLTLILSQALAASSGWTLAALPTNTAWTATKLATAGSGNAAAQLWVTVRRAR